MFSNRSPSPCGFSHECSFVLASPAHGDGVCFPWALNFCHLVGVKKQSCPPVSGGPRLAWFTIHLNRRNTELQLFGLLFLTWLVSNLTRPCSLPSCLCTCLPFNQCGSKVCSLPGSHNAFASVTASLCAPVASLSLSLVVR